ncbi:hypothetical protein BD410DRAFT_684387, partial [Rickenella mellea]
YEPAIIIAAVNDTVTFVFGGKADTVTQTTFESPCVKMPGGFDSGYAGVGTNTSGTQPTWDLHISDSSQPIWFFCQAVVPASHCAAGMVGYVVFKTPRN